MKFLHTSDLHIGLRLCGYSMTEDVRHILKEIADIAVRERCDAVIVAGDIYDRAAPSAEAVAVLDEFFSALAKERIAVLAVAGNHDSPERVAYLSEVAASAGLYLSPVYSGTCGKVRFTDEYGDADVYLLPFVKPVNVRAVCAEFDGDSYTAAMECAVARMKPDESVRNILVTHQFVVGGTSVEAEDVGGTGAVAAGVFDGFDYVALGHLHTAHPVGKTAYYSGSPLKYSFAEAEDEKSVSMVELREKGNVTVERVMLHPVRDLREVRGTYDAVVYAGLHDPAKNDYLRVTLTDEEDVVDAVAKLRCVYPNLMRLMYDNKRTRAYREVDGTEASEADNGTVRPEEVFAELYELQNNVPPEEELLDVVRGIFEVCMEGEFAE